MTGLSLECRTANNKSRDDRFKMADRSDQEHHVGYTLECQLSQWLTSLTQIGFDIIYIIIFVRSFQIYKMSSLTLVFVCEELRAKMDFLCFPLCSQVANIVRSRQT
jgi:hypothetical protein